jgi:predicted Rossmann-fold nucleotide-binding protein
VINFEALVRHGTIAADDLKLFQFVDAPAAALEVLKRRVPAEAVSTPQVQFAASRCAQDEAGG